MKRHSLDYSAIDSVPDQSYLDDVTTVSYSSETHEDEPAGTPTVLDDSQLEAAKTKLENAGWKIRGTWYEDDSRGQGELHVAASHVPYKFLRRFRWQPNGGYWQQFVEAGRGRWTRID
jgi:hypothetical protein